MARRSWIIPFLIFLILIPVIYYLLSDNFHDVIPDKVYRSAQLSPDQLEKVIRDKKIQSIINLRGTNRDEKWYINETAVARKHGVHYFDINLMSTKLPKFSQINLLFKTLQNAPQPILMHCLNGSDRSGLAGALALAIINDSSLAQLKQQISWRYFSFRPSSTGRLFFRAYENWLDSKPEHQHSTFTLQHWIKNKYVDAQGNIEYWIDAIGHTRFEEDFWGRDVAKLDAPDRNLIIHGWAYNPRTQAPVDNLVFEFADNYRVKVSFVNGRPDVANWLGLNPEQFKNKKLGWTVSVDTRKLIRGCQPIIAHLEKTSVSPERSFTTRFFICLDE